MKLKAKCCKKYKRKARACKRCPLLAGLDSRQRKSRKAQKRR